MKIVRKIIILMILVLLMSVNIFADEEDRIYDDEKDYVVVELMLFEDRNVDTEVYDSDNDNVVSVDEDFGDGNQQVVWVKNDAEGNPHMPKIKFVFEPSESIDYVMCMKLKVEYYVNVVSGSYTKQTSKTKELNDGTIIWTFEDIDYFPDYDGNTSTGEHEYVILTKDDTKEWIVDFGNYFCGGEATLYWEVYDEGEMINDGKYTFYIRGQNPHDSVVINYIQNIPSHRWYYVPIVEHETIGLFDQFNRLRTDKESVSRNYGSEQTDFEGCPLWGGPDGWGIMQLEIEARLDRPEEGLVRPRERDHQLLWNWMYNVDTGIRLLEQKRVAAEIYLNRQIALAGESEINMEDFETEYDWWYDVEDEDGNFIRRVYGTHVPDYGNVTFQDTRFNFDAEYTFLDAITIKMYNGASRPESDTMGNSGHFIEWNEENREWICHPLNCLEPPNNYVEDIYRVLQR